MKDAEQIKKDLGYLYGSDVEKLKTIQGQIDSIIKAPTINEDNYRTLLNIMNDLRSFEETYITRLLRLYKQNHII
jgi:hypothetical protein